MAKAVHVPQSVPFGPGTTVDTTPLHLTIDTPVKASPSPARRMQETLGREFAALEVDNVPAWPLRRTVALVMMSCGAFWTAVYFVVAALVG